MNDAISKYFAEVGRAGLWPSEAGLRRYLAFLFGDVPLRGARVLDVGGGTGLFTMYAAASGAAEVTCLEPEAEGGLAGMNDTFRRLLAATGLANVRLVPSTLQAFDAAPGSFDVVLLHNSINHIDEPACVRLRDDERARETYRGLFRRIAELSCPDAHLVITDSSSANVFPLLGLRHPASPLAEWHKHQPPEVWALLLQDAGFCNPHVSWSSYNRLGRLGWMLLANRVGAFLTTSHFRLLMRKCPRPASAPTPMPAAAAGAPEAVPTR